MLKCYNVSMIDALDSTMFSSAVSLFTPVVALATQASSNAPTSSSTKNTEVVNQVEDINDSASISLTAIDMLKTEQANSQAQQQSESQQQNASSQNTDSDKEAAKTPQLKLVDEELSVDEYQQVIELKQTDEEVRKHNEVQTMAARGIQVTPAKYQTEKGPDGKEYVVSGKVDISFIPTNNAKENLQKAQILKKAALSAVPPTTEDIKLAQKASKLIDKYSREIKSNSLSGYFKEGRRA